MTRVYDRSKNIFCRLVDEEDFRFSVLQSLLAIYQAVSNLYKEIDIAKKN
ncbi:MAG: hypothetical protein ACEY3I_02820 [Arsenophonus sp.]